MRSRSRSPHHRALIVCLALGISPVAAPSAMADPASSGKRCSTVKPAGKKLTVEYEGDASCPVARAVIAAYVKKKPKVADERTIKVKGRKWDCRHNADKGEKGAGWRFVCSSSTEPWATVLGDRLWSESSYS